MLIYRASRPEDLVLYRELEAIAHQRGLGLFARVGPRGRPHEDPLRAAELRAIVPDLAEREVYLCGPAGMTQTVGAHLRTAGVPRRRIHIEAFEL